MDRRVGIAHHLRLLPITHYPLPIRSGFTLVEILVVIAIIVLLAGLILAVAGSAIGTSKEKATRVLLDQVQKALDARMDKFLQDTKHGMPIQKYALMAGAPNTNAIPPNSILSKRAAILARMDSMRSAFPQYFAEILPSQGVVNVFTVASSSNDFAAQMETVTENAANAALGLATAPVINPYPTHQTILIKYLVGRGYLASNQEFSAAGGIDWVMTLPACGVDPPPSASQLSRHDPETESSECLYLILSDNTVGDNILDAIKNNIKDTDGDGLMEIVDAWGRPIKYYRWPTDLYAYWIEISRQMPVSAAKNTLDPDGLLYDVAWLSLPVKEYFETIAGRLHPAYNNDAYLQDPPDLTINVEDHSGIQISRASQARQYPFRPVLVSAGPDGRFGLYNLETNIPGVGVPNELSDFHAVHFLGLRTGRVVEDDGERNSFADNVFSIEWQEGTRR